MKEEMLCLNSFLTMCDSLYITAWIKDQGRRIKEERKTAVTVAEVE